MTCDGFPKPLVSLWLLFEVLYEFAFLSVTLQNANSTPFAPCCLCYASNSSSQKNARRALTKDVLMRGWKAEVWFDFQLRKKAEIEQVDSMVTFSSGTDTFNLFCLKICNHANKIHKFLDERVIVRHQMLSCSKRRGQGIEWQLPGRTQETRRENIRKQTFSHQTIGFGGNDYRRKPGNNAATWWWDVLSSLMPQWQILGETKTNSQQGELLHL